MVRFAHACVLAALVSSPLAAQVNPVALEGQSVSSAEQSLINAGYHQTRSHKKDGDTWIYFRNQTNGYYPCIGLVTSAGRVATALSLGEDECHKGGDAGAAVAGVAIAALIGAALVGQAVRALSEV